MQASCPARRATAGADEAHPHQSVAGQFLCPENGAPKEIPPDHLDGDHNNHDPRRRTASYAGPAWSSQIADSLNSLNHLGKPPPSAKLPRPFDIGTPGSGRHGYFISLTRFTKSAMSGSLPQ